MSEIYRNTSQFVYLDILGGSVDGLPTAVSKTGNGTVRNLNVSAETAPDGVAERFSATLGLADTQEAGEVSVIWNFSMDNQPVSKTDYFDVVVPLVDLSDIRRLLDLDPDEYSEERIIQAERRVRQIIESYTGQSFDARTETLILTGSGDKVLRFPKRIISISGINNNFDSLVTASFQVRSNGFGLSRIYPFTTGTIRSGGFPITAPYNVAGWRHGVEWSITGRFGWERVPAKVAEAAIILIEAELSEDTLYRDRYLTSMTAADWRIQFNALAFRGSGNVSVDQLLADYRVSNLAVV